MEKTLTIVVYMLSKDPPKYRPHMSFTLEAGQLNWIPRDLWVSRRLDELHSFAVI